MGQVQQIAQHKTLNQLYKESGKKVSFKEFAKQYNEMMKKEQSLVAETVTQQSSGKDYSSLQIIAAIGIIVGVYFLIKKD
jgi:hypothetical protein